MAGPLGLMLALVLLDSALAYPFNLDHMQHLAKLAKLGAAAGPYAANQFKPLFNPHFASGQQQQQQYGTVQQYGGAAAGQQYNPVDYLADPLGSFPPRPYNHGYDQIDFTKMVGESFFKRPGGQQEEEETREEVPYSVVKDFGTYEERFYPSAKFACVKSEVDTSKDPMAGLEKENPFVIMSSKRWKKSPASIMFMELFKYIAGVNQDGQEVEMTRPVSTLHKVDQKQAGGDIEVQEMCFYLPQKFQASPPQPLERSPVYILERPEMAVYALKFGGFALSADAWLAQKDLLESYIVGKPHKENEYFTNGYNSPFALTNRRNEIWIQCTSHETKPVGEAVEASPLPEQVAEASPLPGQVPVEAVPLPGKVAEPVPLPGQVVEAVPLPGQIAEAVPLPGQAAEASEVKAVTYSLEAKSEEQPEVSVKPAPLPSDVAEAAPLPADVAKPAPLPAEVADPAPLPADATKPAPLPADAAEAAPLPADAAKPAPLPADVANPEPLPADVANPVPLPGEVVDAAPLPADATKPAPLPADVAEAAPLPADAAEAAPLPAEVAEAAPLPAEVAEAAPLPADVPVEGVSA